MKMIKKILSMILVISMLVGLSVSAFAWDHKPPMPPKPEQPKTYSVKEIDVEVVGNYEADSVTVVIGDKSVSNTSYQQLEEAEYDDEDNEWELKFKNNKSWKLSQYPTKDNVVVYLNGTVVSVREVELDEGELDIKVSAPVNTYTVTINYVDAATNQPIEGVESKVYNDLKKGNKLNVKDDLNKQIDGYTRVSSDGPNNGKVTVGNENIVYTVKYNKNKTTNTTAEIKVFITGEHEKKSATVAYGNYSASTTESGSDSRWENDGEGDHWELDLHGDDKWELPTELNANDFTVTIDGNEATVTSVENIYDTTWCDQEYELYIYVTMPEAKPETYNVTVKYECDGDVTLPENIDTEVEAGNFEFALPTIEGYDATVSVEDYTVTENVATITVNSDINVVVTYVKQTEVPGDNKPEEEEPVPTAYPVYVFVKATDDVKALGVFNEKPDQWGYYLLGRMNAAGIRQPVVQNPRMTGNEADQSAAATALKNIEVLKIGGEGYLNADANDEVVANILANVAPEYEEVPFLKVVDKEDFPTGYAPEGFDGNGIPTWHYNLVLQETTSGEPEIKPEPVDPPKSTIDIHVHIENNYKPGKLTLDYGAGTIVESQFSNNYDEVLKCWVKPDVDPDSLPALETDNFEVTLNGYTAFVSDVVKDEDGNAVCIHVDVPDVVYVYVCVVDENGNIIEEDAPNAEAAKEVVRPYFKNVNSTKKYYTLGSISVDGLPAPVYNDHNKGKLSDVELEAQFEAYADLLIPGLEEKIDLFKLNWAEGADDAKIKEMMKDVTWNVLHVDNGANNYNLGTVDGKIKPAVWHLDGYLTLKTEEPETPPTEEPEQTEPQKFTVTFVDHDGTTVLKTEEVEEGKAATAPTVLPHEGYTFNSWDKAFDKITESITVTAQCTKNETTGGNEGGEGEQQPDNGDNDDDNTTVEPTDTPTDNNNNNNNNDGGDYYPPTPDTPVGGGGDETIVDEDVPLGGEPEGDETIEDEDVPLGDMPEEELEEIEDEDVPLDATPKTGNALRMIRNIAFAIAALSFSGLMASVVITKKKFDF